VSEVITASTLQRDLIEAGHNLRDAITDLRDAAAVYVRLKYEHQRAWDVAYLNAEGNDQARKSTANLATVELAKAADEALEHKRNARIQVEAFQGIVSAIQTVGATARAEMRLS
jgi:hypothetical protein